MKIIIPTTLTEITIEQYLKFQKVSKADDITQDILELAMVTIFCNLTITQARQIESKDYNEIILHLTELLDQKPTFIQRFTLGGIEYGFIPNLNKASAGEYIDIEKFLQEEDTYALAMSVMFRPVTEKAKGLYRIEPYQDAERFKDVMTQAPLECLLGAMVFFCNLSRELLRATQAYLQNPTQRMEVEAALLKSGVGISQFIQSLEAAHLILSERLKWKSIIL